MKKPPMNHRDNFTSKTIEIAAKRVGYLCSFPGCGALTIGPGSDKEHPTAKMGQGAHICAAAPGGPRYDKKMTTEERKSEENCIWLCENHARLIDVDPNRYSAEKLRQWKKEAEERARQALENMQKLPSLPNGESMVDSSLIKQLLDPLIQEGRYPEALAYCTKLEDMSLAVDARNRLKFYFVVLAFYCDKAALESRLDACVSCHDSVLDNDLTRFFVEVGDVPHIKKTLANCTDAFVVSFGQYFINRTLEESFPMLEKLPKIEDPKKNHDRTIFLNKLFSSYFLQKRQIMTNKQGEIAYFLGEFYYQVLANAFLLVIDWHNHCHDLNVSPRDNPHYVFLVQSLDKISHFDPEILKQVWFSILYFSSLQEPEFKRAVPFVPDSVRSFADIKEILLSADISLPCPKERETSFIDFALEQKHIYPLCCLLNLCLASDPQYVIGLLDEHLALFETSPLFLSFYLVALQKLGAKGKILPLIDRYYPRYSSNLVFRCISYQAARWEQDEPRMAKEKDFLASTPIDYSISQPDVLLNAYGLAGLYDKVNDFVSEINDPNLQELGLSILLNSDDPAFCPTEKKLIGEMVKKRYDFDSETALGVCEKTQGNLAEADVHFLKAVQTRHGLCAASNSLILHDLQEREQYPETVALARTSTHSEILTLVASHYRNKGDLDEARIFSAKAILRDSDETVGLNRYFSWEAEQKHSEDANLSFVCKNSVLTLKDQDGTRVIAVVDPFIVEGIDHPHLGNCLFFGADDARVASLSLAERNSKAFFEGKEYVIIEIVDFWLYLFRFCREKLVKTNNLKMISVGTDPVGAISKLMQETADSNERLIQKFNRKDHPPFPLEFLSGACGGNEIKVLSFLLYQNKAPFINNLNHFVQIADASYVLSYDALFLLYSMGLSKSSLPFSFLIPNSVVSSLRNDLDKERAPLISSGKIGSLVLDGGKAKRLVSTDEQKKQSLNEIKRLEALLASFPHAETSFDPHFDEQGTMVKDLIELHALMEPDCIGLCQSQKNRFVLISDDPFLYSLAGFAKVPTMGIVGLLEKANLDFHGLLHAVLVLEGYPNFDNYLTPTLLNRLHSLCRGQKDLDDLVTFLGCQGLEDEARITKRKKQIIGCVFAIRDDSTLYPDELQILLDHFLVSYYSELEPEKFQKIINGTFESPIQIKTNFVEVGKSDDTTKKGK